MPNARKFTNSWKEGKEPGSGLFEITLVWVLEAFNWVLSVLYNTMYFYFTPFLPIMLIIVLSSTYRNEPTE
jgi:hypothetical protein